MANIWLEKLNKKINVDPVKITMTVSIPEKLTVVINNDFIMNSDLVKFPPTIDIRHIPSTINISKRD